MKFINLKTRILTITFLGLSLTKNILADSEPKFLKETLCLKSMVAEALMNPTHTRPYEVIAKSLKIPLKNRPKYEPFVQIQNEQISPNLRPEHKIVRANQILPIIYHPSYNIAYEDKGNEHPFDGKKYGKVFDELTAFLKKQNDNNPKQMIEPVHKVSDQDLLLVHTQRYLDSLNDPKVIAQITELKSLAFLPKEKLNQYLLDPMRYATQGTIMGAELALKEGWAINLSGGYHHAKSDEQHGGFCFFADIPLAVRKLQQERPNLKVLIVDLDAHQGNGHEAILGNDSNVKIFDIYNESAYPHNYDNTQRFITYNYPIAPGTSDATYLKIVYENLPRAIAQHKPDLIIYNAGTDILSGDQVGRLNVSKEGIIERDNFVFEAAQKTNTPILMVLSGGYTQESAPVIAASLKQVLQKKGF